MSPIRRRALILRIVIGVVSAGGLTTVGGLLVPSGAAAASTLTVTSASGDATTPGSLPYEVARAAPGDTIDFDIAGGGAATITLPATLVITTSDLTIIGAPDPQQPPSSPLITVSPAAGMAGSGIVVGSSAGGAGVTGVTLRDISVSGFSGNGIEIGAGASRTTLTSDTAQPAAISGNARAGIAVTAAAGGDNRFGGYRIQDNGGGPFAVAAPAFAAGASIDSSGTQATVTVSGASPGEPISVQAGADPGCGGTFAPYPGNTATATTDSAGEATLTVTVSPPAHAPDGIRVLVTGQNDGTVPVSRCVVAALAPTATITAPLPASTVGLGQVVPTHFACQDGAGGPGIRVCADSEGHGAPTGRLDTASVGPHTYTVTAISADGEAASTSLDYTVAAAPTIELRGLRSGRRVLRGTRMRIRFVCREGRAGPGLSLCRGSIRSGSLLPTRRLGSFRVTVLALSRDGQSARMTVRYRVVPARHRRRYRPHRHGRAAHRRL